MTSESVQTIYERLYSQNQFLRERLQKSFVWCGAVFLATNSWFVTNGLTVSREVLYLISAFYLWLALGTIYSIYFHYSEYLANARMIVRIERALGVYEKGRHFPDESLFSQESMAWGTGKYSRHILVGYLILILLLLFLSVAMLFVLNSAPE